ncbi:hypothetical protein WJX74_001366 [Apatococcus lobatus]|uniref:Uncharacterized protein n=1 Tax=Apatococcus lobatus TaxID=904363 RepID=A0AAW1QZM5_9CHLO
MSSEYEWIRPSPPRPRPGVSRPHTFLPRDTPPHPRAGVRRVFRRTAPRSLRNRSWVHEEMAEMSSEYEWIRPSPPRPRSGVSRPHTFRTQGLWGTTPHPRAGMRRMCRGTAPPGPPCSQKPLLGTRRNGRNE